MTSLCEIISTALQAHSSEDCWVLMYPLQLLSIRVPLAPLLGMPATAQLQAMTDTGSVQAPHISSMSGTPVPQPSGKQWHCSAIQGMPNPRPEEEESAQDVVEEAPHKKVKSYGKNSQGGPM